VNNTDKQLPVEIDNDLIAGILKDAEAEAERIIKEAQQSAASRLENAHTQAAAIIDEAKQSAAKQAETIRQQMADKILTLQRRAALRVQEDIFNQVLEETQSELAAQVKLPEYRKILIGWIVEAAIGLDVVNAFVNASAIERPLIDADLLRDAAVKLKEITGRDVTFQVSTNPPTLLQGIVLQTTEGGVEYNNHLVTRLTRCKSEIRKIIYAELFD
jgi:vacuolar-type H+-ATPase subunit E/Vma4